jgi:prepilin-type N-terminal cleavage/methylation domain-containing protein
MRVGTGFSLVELLIVISVVGILGFVAYPSYESAHVRAVVGQAEMNLQSLSIAFAEYHTTFSAFPPAGNVSQNGWTAWQDSLDTWLPNAPSNNLYACSVLWVPGSFYDHAGDSSAGSAAFPPSGTIHYDLRMMTSPVGVLAEIPLDPFKNSGQLNSQYDYFGLNLASEYVLRSLGPDRIAAAGCEPGGFRCSCSSDCLSLENGAPGRIDFDGGASPSFGCAGCATLSEALSVGSGVYSPTNGTTSAGDIFRTSAAALPSEASKWRLF